MQRLINKEALKREAKKKINCRRAILGIRKIEGIQKPEIVRGWGDKLFEVEALLKGKE